MRKIIILTIMLIILVIGLRLIELSYSISDLLLRTTSGVVEKPVESSTPHIHVVLTMVIMFIGVILGYIIVIVKSIRGRRT